MTRETKELLCWTVAALLVALNIGLSGLRLWVAHERRASVPDLTRDDFDRAFPDFSCSCSKSGPECGCAARNCVTPCAGGHHAPR
jgi:hypothetical protein